MCARAYIYSLVLYFVFFVSGYKRNFMASASFLFPGTAPTPCRPGLSGSGHRTLGTSATAPRCARGPSSHPGASRRQPILGRLAQHAAAISQQPKIGKHPGHLARGGIPTTNQPLLRCHGGTRTLHGGLTAIAAHETTHSVEHAALASRKDSCARQFEP